MLSHVVFAEPDHTPARDLLAHTFEQLGYGSENGTWRDVLLSGAHELRHGNFGTPSQTASPDMVAQLSPEQLFDTLAIRVDGPRAWNETLTLEVASVDSTCRYRLRLANGVITHTAARQTAPADATLLLPLESLAQLLLQPMTPQSLDDSGASLDGDPTVLSRLLDVLDQPDPDFDIVTPWPVTPSAMVT